MCEDHAAHAHDRATPAAASTDANGSKAPSTSAAANTDTSRTAKSDSPKRPVKA
jgi:hypothetical protein